MVRILFLYLAKIKAMKHITLLLLLLPIYCNGQRIKTNLSELKLPGTLACEFARIVEDSDTSYHVYCGFQNQKYTHITDIGSVFIISQSELNELIDALGKAAPYIGVKGQAVSFDYRYYSLKIYDFSKELYVIDEKGKYTTLPKNQVLQWVEWLKSIQFP